MVKSFDLEANSIILIDGECNFCNRTLMFILKYDIAEIFYFGSQQSNVAQNLLSKYNCKDELLSTIYLIQNGRVYTKSSAIIEIANRLSGYPRYLSLLRIVPTPIRDYFYDLFSKYRFFFGRRTTVCVIPTPSLITRMIKDN